MRWAVEVPTKPVLAELRYDFDGTVWSAIVTRAEDSAEYQLWIQRGNRYQKSGTFGNPKALVKYIREIAGKKFGDFKAVKDNLDVLTVRGNPDSLVPPCFGRLESVSIGPNMYGPSDPKCRKCPYEMDCMRVSSGVGMNEDQGLFFEPGGDPEKLVGAPENAGKPDEPEDLFIRRLQDKISQKWGK